MGSISCNTQSNKQIGDKLIQFQWSVAGKIPDRPNGTKSLGLAGPVTGISNNRLIVGGGSNFPNGAPWEGGTKKYYDKVSVFKKEGDTIVSVNQNLHLPFPIAYSANCTTDKGVVVAGGQNGDRILDEVWLLIWDTDKQKLDIQSLPSLPQPLTAGRISVIKNRVYLVGGQNEKGVSDQLYRLDLNQRQSGWDTLAQLPKPVTHTVLYANANENKLYIVGGRKSNKGSTSTLYSDVYEYDIKSNKWTQKTSLPYALSAHTGLTWNDSTLLVFSGDRGKTFHATEGLMVKITNEKDPEKKQQLILEKKELQKNHPGFSGDVLAYNTHTNEWRKIDSIPFPGQVTTTAVRWGNDVVIPCGEIRAGVRTPDIVMGGVK